MTTKILAAPYPSWAETDSGDAFVDSTLVCFLIVALPFKNLAYFAPLIFIMMQLFWGDYGFVKRALMWGCALICISATSILCDSLSGQTVNVPGLMFGILTYASLVVMLALRLDFTISPVRWHGLRRAVSWFVIIQSVIGLIQFAISRDADAVCGTFGLFDFLCNITIAQVYLTFNLFAMILFLLIDRRGTLENIAIVLGIVVSILAHSGHQTLFLMASLACVGMLQLRLKALVKIVGFLFALVMLTASVSSIYWSDIEGWYQKVAVDDDSPKRLVALSAKEIMSSPKNLLLGVGMGQFGSRAALISSGDYLTIPLPVALVGESDYFRKSVQPARDAFAEYGETSAMSAPYCSALNLIVEFGLPLTLFILFAVAVEIFWNWRQSRSVDPHTQSVCVLGNVGLILFVLCCFVENYVEFPQAVFLPGLLYFAARASMRTV
jgi:hypothetical protein